MLTIFEDQRLWILWSFQVGFGDSASAATCVQFVVCQRQTHQNYELVKRLQRGVRRGAGDVSLRPCEQAQRIILGRLLLPDNRHVLLGVCCCEELVFSSNERIVEEISSTWKHTFELPTVPVKQS